MGNLTIGITIAVIILAALFLILREAVCWYWKINRMVRLLEAISGKFDSLDRGIKLIADRQLLPAAGFPGTPPAENRVDSRETYEKWETGHLLDSLKSSGCDAATKETIEQVLSARYGIRFEEGKYRYRDYVCDDLAAAAECAQLYNKR